MVEPKLLPALSRRCAGPSSCRVASWTTRPQYDHSAHPRQHPDVGEDLGGAAAGRVGVHLHDRTLAPGLPGRDPDEDRVTAPPSWRRSTGAATGPHGQMDQLDRRTLIAVKVGIPREVKNHEYRVAITPGRRARAGQPRPRGLRRDATPASAPPSPTRTTSRPAPRSWTRADDVWGDRRPDPQGQGADRQRVRPDARGPDALHLPAPGRRPGPAPRRWSSARSPASPTRPSSCRTGSLPLLAPMTEVAGRLAPQVGCRTR